VPWKFERLGRAFVEMAQFVNSGAAVVFLLASLAVLASAAPPKPSDWQLCGKF